MEARSRRQVQEARWPIQFLAVFLFAGLVPSLFMIPFARVLLRPEAYQYAAAAQQPDQQMLELLVDFTTRSESGIDDQAQRGLVQMGRERLRESYRQILPANWAKDQVDVVMSGMLDYLNLRNDQLSMTVDLVPFKEALGAHSQEMAGAMVASWPACSASDLLTMGEQALSGELTGIPYCQPPEILQPVVVQVARVIIAITAEQLPDRLDLATWVGWQGNPWWWDGYRVFHLFLTLVPLFTLFVLILMLLLSVQNIGTGFTLIGRTMIFAGLTGAGLLLVGFVLFQPLMAAVFSGPLRLLPDGFANFFQNMARLVAARYAISAGILSLTAVAWGFGFAGLPVVLETNTHH